MYWYLSHSLCIYLLPTLKRFYFLTAYQDIQYNISVLFLYIHIHILSNPIIIFLSDTNFKSYSPNSLKLYIQNLQGQSFPPRPVMLVLPVYWIASTHRHVHKNAKMLPLFKYMESKY